MRNGRINCLLGVFHKVYQNDGGQGGGQGGEGGGQGGEGQGGGAGGNGAGGEGGAGGGAGGAGGGAGKKTFTEDDFNKAIAGRLGEEKRKWNQQQKDLVSQLEQLKTNANLTVQERDELQQRIDTLTAQFTTKEEQAKQEREKLEKNWTKEKDTLLKDRDNWKTNYSQLYVDIEIRKAANKNGAYSEEQMVDYLAPRAKLTPEIGEDNKPTGKFVPTITFQDQDKDQKPVTLELSIADAIKRMKELPDRFGNFFKVEGSGGIGGSNRPGGTSGGTVPTGFRRDMTPEEYREWRKKQGRGAGVVRK